MKRAIVVLTLTMLTAPGCRSIVNKMAFHPDRASTIPKERLPSGIEEIFITTADGLEIQAYLVSHRSSEKLVIFFHGNAGNISYRMPDLLRLRQCGVSVLGVGYRGYGKSEGNPSEKGIYRDGIAAFSYATDVLRYEPKQIYIFGRSIGTTVAIHTAQEKDIAGLILVSPLTSGKRQAKATGLGSLSFVAGSSFRNIDKIRNVTCPTVVIHGTQDRVIPYKMGAEIYDRIRTKKRMITIHGAGHNNISSDFRQAYWSPISDFITKGISK